MTKDMTSGSPARLILRFTIPLIFGNLFQQFYSMVDTIIVGRFLGKESLAAVGSTGSINFLIIGFCLGLCSGFAIPVSQQFGAKNFAEMKKYIGNTIWLTIWSSVLFTVATVLLCRPMLEWMNTPSDIIEEAYWYIVVIFAGIVNVNGDGHRLSSFLYLAIIIIYCAEKSKHCAQDTRPNKFHSVGCLLTFQILQASFFCQCIRNFLR